MASNIVEIILQAKDRATQVLNAVENGTKKLSSASQSYRQTLQRLNGTADNFRRTMQRVVAIVGITGLARSFLQVNASAEKTKIMLQGLAGSAEAANKEFEWILDFSTKAPFSIDALKDAYVKLRVSGLDPMRGSLQTLTDAVAAFGGSDEDLKLVTIAIQQMAGKGVVSMEELRQQIGERIPTAMQAMAEGLGMTMAQLSKEIEKGNISAQQGIDAMMRKLQEMYSGSGATMMHSWTGLVSNLRVAWEKFSITLGETGLFERLKSILDGLLKKLEEMKKSGDLSVWAKRISDTVSSLVTVFVHLAGVVSKFLDIAGPYLPFLVQAIAYTKLFKLIVGNTVGAVIHFKNQIIALKEAFIIFQGTKVISYIKSLTTSLIGATGATKTLGTVLGRLIPIVGAFVAGWQIGKIISQWTVFGHKISEWVEVAWTYMDQFFTNMKIGWITIKKYAKEAFTLGIADTSAEDRELKRLENYKQIIINVRKEILNNADAQKKAAIATDAATKSIDTQIKKMNDQKQSAESVKKTYEDLIDSLEEGSAQWIAIKEKELKTLKAQTDYETALLEQSYREGKISYEKYLSERKALQENYIQEVIRLKEMEMEALKKEPEKNLEEIKAVEEEIKQIKLQSIQERLKMEQSYTEALKKKHEDELHNWEQIQDLKLQNLKARLDLEAAIEQAAVDQGLMRQSDFMARQLQRLKEQSQAEIEVITEKMQRIAEIEGTGSMEYQKLYAERERLQNELQTKIIQSEVQINQARINEEQEAQKFLANLVDDRIKLHEIEAEQKLMTLKRYYEQALISESEYAQGVEAIEKGLTAKLEQELSDRSRQLTEWANIIADRTKRMWDAVSGFFSRDSYDDVLRYFGGVKEALSITTEEVRQQIQSFLDAINRGTYETFLKAELFGRRITEMVGISIYDWARKVTEYINHVRELMEGLKGVINRYREELLRMKGDEVALVELWYKREFEKLKEQYKGLERTPEYQEALKLLKELYDEKLKKAKESMEREKEMMKDMSEETIRSADTMGKVFDKLRDSVKDVSDSIKGISSGLSTSLGMGTELKVSRDVNNHFNYEIRTFDSETTRRWLRDTVFPEWERYLSLRGVKT